MPVAGLPAENSTAPVALATEKLDAKLFPAPHYPRDMMKHGQSGEVLISFIVTKEGNVRDLKALKATNESFATAAKEAVLRGRYQPTMKDGEPVESRYEVPIRFVVETSNAESKP
jgi:TonB family protein